MKVVPSSETVVLTETERLEKFAVVNIKETFLAFRISIGSLVVSDEILLSAESKTGSIRIIIL